MSDSIVLHQVVNRSESKSLWIFGYGSLCWKPGFQFDKAVTGYVKGYSRKFWQGNKTHRGTDEKPGRVATLVKENKESVVHGVAFAVSGEAAIPYLNQRECTLGGYSIHFTTFYPTIGEPIMNILLYIATPSNELWLGDAPTSVIASEILESSGSCGHNVEYLIRLGNFMRLHFPDEDDNHLFTLEKEVVSKLEANAMSFATLMGTGAECVTFTRPTTPSGNPPRSQERERTDSFQFTTRVAEKALRCLNI